MNLIFAVCSTIVRHSGDFSFVVETTPFSFQPYPRDLIVPQEISNRQPQLRQIGNNNLQRESVWCSFLVICTARYNRSCWIDITKSKSFPTVTPTHSLPDHDPFPYSKRDDSECTNPPKHCHKEIPEPQSFAPGYVE